MIEDTPSVVRVLLPLPLPLPGPLDYLVPSEMPVPEAGAFVRVPLGSRRMAAVVWNAGEPDIDMARLKPIIEALPAPPMQPELRRFVDRVASYTLAAPGAVLRMCMSVEAALSPAPQRRLCRITPAGRRVLSDTGAR